MNTSSKITCIKYGPDQDALDYLPWPGELGQRIVEQVSQQFWNEWLEHQTKLINENRWSVRDPAHRAKLEAQMRAFLFGEGELAEIEGFVPPEKSD